MRELLAYLLNQLVGFIDDQQCLLFTRAIKLLRVLIWIISQRDFGGATDDGEQFFRFTRFGQITINLTIVNRADNGV